MKQQAKKKVTAINSVHASDSRYSRKRTFQIPSAISIMGDRNPNFKPAVTVTTQWRDAQPTLALRKLLLRLLSTPKRYQPCRRTLVTDLQWASYEGGVTANDYL